MYGKDRIDDYERDMLMSLVKKQMKRNRFRIKELQESNGDIFDIHGMETDNEEYSILIEKLAHFFTKQ